MFHKRSLRRGDDRRRRTRILYLCTFALILPGVSSAGAQTAGALQGRIVDVSGAVLPGATVTVRNAAGFDRTVVTDEAGRYRVDLIPAGSYEVAAAAAGFKSAVIGALLVEVGRTVVQDVRLTVGDRSEAVEVSASVALVDRVTTSVGHVVAPRTVREIPLNGRYFADLALLGAGAVAPSQTGFSARPGRGIGAQAINVAGHREEATGFAVNGVTTNNLTFGSLGFQPPIASLQEFRIDTSPFTVEHGHVSGAIVNIVTRSGVDEFHGGAFEFMRNDGLDARNFFESTTDEPHPFERHQFGGFLGGPLDRDQTFFFATYEGLRQRQGLDMHSLVLSDEQRAAATDPTSRMLIGLIPHANAFDPDGTPRFVGSAAALVDDDRWTIDLRQRIGANDSLHVFYGDQRIYTREPGSNGTTIPGFGHVFRSTRGILTLGYTHIFGSALLNDARFGRSDLEGTATPAAELNPLDFGIRNGVTRPIGLPQLRIAGGLSFGGPERYPTGRDDASYVVADTLSFARGRHFVRLGGEYRHFLNENFDEGTGAFNFPTVEAFLVGTANDFGITLGERRNNIDQRAVAAFVQDRVTLRPDLTLELGLRYEWHVTPTERNNQFVVFDAASVSLRRVGVDIDEIYRQNDRNLEPRVGVAWDLSRDGHTVVRAAYGLAVDQPSTTTVRDTTGNPPFAIPVRAAGSIRFDDAIDRAHAIGLAPSTVDPEFRNARLQSWNVNVQRQLGARVAVMAGYFGSRGRDLRITRNINQPAGGVRPFAALSSSSPILPGEALGNIAQVESSGFSRYDALWISATKRLSRGLELDASYTWSKSRDTNSLNSSNFVVQDAYDIPNEYGLSDFDARHRVVLRAIYEFPFAGHLLTRGWQVAAIVQSQSGNPVNIVTSTSTLNGLPNTVRPDVTRPIAIIGSVNQWFDPRAFVAVDRFGNLGRNVVIGPAFHNTDVSLIRNLGLAGRCRVQLRVDVFDVFNHPNFGPPGNIVDSPTFGKISRTRFPTGEAGSSRQIQLAVRFSY